MTILRRARRCLFIGVVVAMALSAGCTRPRRGEQIGPQFSAGARTQKPMASDPLSGADQPGALYDNVRLDLVPANERRGGPRTPFVREPGAAPTPAAEGLSKTVQENVTAPGLTEPAPVANGANGAATTATTTSPATQGVSVGEFFTIGGVVAEVNST